MPWGAPEGRGASDHGLELLTFWDLFLLARTFKTTIQASVKVLKTRPLATWKRGYYGTKEINFKRNRALQN
ncbi:unnamed protein product [Rhizophagus irregularis]|nr:unnamed protein product [Rhizophagus irregularis]